MVKGGLRGTFVVPRLAQHLGELPGRSEIAIAERGERCGYFL
ncbi:hypothetical protein [Streptomyces noursei]|nr:hypothetical protein [Streptomyces noursei]